MQGGLSMEKELLELSSDFFAKVGKTDECHRIIDEYEHVYQFELEGKPAFFIELNRGVITVNSGAHNKGKYGETSLNISMVITSSKTLKDLLTGKLSGLDASKQGLWAFRIVSWSDQLLYTLFRIGREILIEKLIAAQP
jgi:hypothetical protein